MRIAIIVKGLIEKSDSIGYDAVFHYRTLKDLGFEVNLFSEVFAAVNYPNISIIHSNKLKDYSHDLIIYHWCDGWSKIDDYLMAIKKPVIIRWHNNTPPWFFAPYCIESVKSTLKGFTNILQMATCKHIHFWVNSYFSKEQLQFLAINSQRIKVVYPASYYIERKVVNNEFIKKISTTLNLLFVGRIVPHKGHRHILMVVKELQKITPQKIKVSFPGRIPSGDLINYAKDLKILAHSLEINLDLPGEVSQETLNDYYKNADVFVCLSEHEGFGLPIIEAIQMGVPVVGYAITAISELLEEDAIYSIKKINYKEIATLQSKKVLSKFTKEIIMQQINQALDLIYNEAEIDKYNIPVEFIGNFVTLHDLNSYTKLLAVINNLTKLTLRLKVRRFLGQFTLLRNLKNFLTDK